MRSRAGQVWAAILLFLIIITLATAKGGDPALYPAKPGLGVQVFIVDDGAHSDLAIPRAELIAHGGEIGPAAAATTTEPWVLVGWGDARFYEATSPWQDRILDGLRAALGGRPTVVHLQGIAQSPDKVWGSNGVHALTLSPAGLAALLTRADRSFAVGNAGGAVHVAVADREPDEAFFQSTEDFSLIHLCNHWTAQLLNAAGLPVTPVIDTLPAGLVLDLQTRAGMN